MKKPICFLMVLCIIFVTAGCGTPSRAPREIGAKTLNCEGIQPQEIIFSQSPFEGKIEVSDLRPGASASGWVWSPWLDICVIKADGAMGWVKISLSAEQYEIGSPHGVMKTLMTDSTNGRYRLAGPVTVSVRDGKAVIETGGKTLTVDSVSAGDKM